MDLDTVIKIGTLVGMIFGACKYIPKGWRWIFSWKMVKRKEFERLQEVEAEYKKHFALIQREKRKSMDIGQEIKKKLQREEEKLRKMNEDLLTEIRKKVVVGPFT